MPRVAVGLEYDGSAYRGWQQQSAAPSVAAVVSQALARVAAHPLELICAGRTDAGVHALGQVAHFDTAARRTQRSWVLGANSELPPDVRVQWAREVPEHFHARYSALWREYHYRILNRPIASALQRDRVAWIREPLAVAPMREAAQLLVGEHDFAAFRAAQCQSRTSLRHLQVFEIGQAGDILTLRVRANAFLHHMVRNLAGWLIAVGKGERQAEETLAVLQTRDRRLAAPTAPAAGLYFYQVGYPAPFGLPAPLPLEAPP
jgi:tRNA pseudouridine38-40 synthase